MTRIDLDEIAGELKDHQIVVAGESYIAPADLAVPQLLEVQKMAGQVIDLDKDPEGSLEVIVGFLTIIFGEEQGTKLAQVCGIRRLSALITALVNLYELDDEAGKAVGSSRASRRAGARSKPTSNGSTKSTSAKRASARKPSEALG